MGKETKALLSAYRSGVKQLEEQLAFYARKREKAFAEYSLTEGSKQQFWYRSDVNGLIRTQNDAAFVCEQIFAFPAGSSVLVPGGSATAFSPTTWRFSLEDVSSGRELTFDEARVPSSGDEPIPLELLAPSSSVGDTFGNQNDYWFYSPSQYLIGRASVLRLRVSNPPTDIFGGTNYDLISNFVLGGYKVY